HAGWIGFNAVSLGFVALIHRGGYFMRHAGSAPAFEPAARESDATTAYLAPFLAILVTAMATGALSVGFDWLYPARVLAVGGVLWMFRRTYTTLTWKLSWQAVAIGAATFLVWVALVPDDLTNKDGWPAALRAIPVSWAAAWIVIRGVGYILAAPIA